MKFLLHARPWDAKVNQHAGEQAPQMEKQALELGSRLPHGVALGSLNPLSLYFLICKMGVVMEPTCRAVAWVK